jgi:hypothetical protein
MSRQFHVLPRGTIMAALVCILCQAVPAQQSQTVQNATQKSQASAASSAALDRMIAAGKSPRELAQYFFNTQRCNECHTIGSEGKLGFTMKGKERAQGFEGCISTLKAMSIVVKVHEDERSVTQRRRARRFEEFGCATCHKLTPGEMGLTEIGAKLAHLHLGCAEVEKLLASPTLPR